MAITARSGQGYLMGGVSDTVPDWLGSYDEGYTAAQTQKESTLRQQEAKQRMAESAAVAQREAARFANEQADREANLKAAQLGLQMPSDIPFDAIQGPGLMPEYQVPVAPEPRAPSEKYADELAGPAVSPAAQANLEPLLADFTQVEKAFELPAGYLRNISILESSGGLNVGNSKGKYVGMFQIGPEVAKDFGITPETAKNPRVAARVAAGLAARNARYLRTSLGREPAAWELYLAHQQGARGAAALLKTPEGRAIDVMTSVYGGDKALAYRVIVGNGGDPNMTAGQFAQMWGQKYSGQPVTIPPFGSTATAPAPAPITSAGYTISATPEPGAMPIANTAEEFKASGNRERIYNRLRGALMPNVVGNVASWFGTQADKDARDALSTKNAEALQWFETPSVRESVTNNPVMLQEAAADPLAFYNKYKNSIGAAPATPGVQTQPPSTAPATPAATPAATPGVQVPPAQTTPGVQAPPPAAPPPTDLGLPNVAATDLIPRTSAADYAGLNDGTGSLANAIARTRPGEVPKTPDLGMYLFDPAMITNDRRLLAMQQDEIQRQLQIASLTRDFTSMANLRNQAVQNQLASNLLGAMEVIATMQQGDNETFARTLSGLTQGRQRLQPRSDGSFNIYYDNELVGEGVSRNQIIATLRMQYDKRYQELAAAQAKASAERETKMLESDLKVNENVLTEEAKARRERATKAAEAQLRADPRYSENIVTTIDQPDGSKAIFIKPKNGQGEGYILQLAPVIDTSGKAMLDGDGNERLEWVYKRPNGTSAVPVQ